MLRRGLASAVLVLVALAAAASAVELSAGLDLAYTAMTHVNGLVVEAPRGGDVSPDLHLAVGGQVSAGFDPEGPVPPVFARLSALSMSWTELDLRATATLFGLACGAAATFGGIDASIAAGVHRGSFEFPAARLVGLHGWGLGVMAAAGYSVRVTPKLEASFRLQGQWLPVPEVSDADGHTYRGRGMPYLDFSGLTASISLGWKP